MVGQKPRVLVLEPHVFQRAVAVRIFQCLDCEQVYQAASAAQALTLLQDAGGVDLIACNLRDVDDRYMDSLEFIHRVGRDKLAKGVLVCGSLTPTLRAALQRMIGELGMHLIGVVDPPLSLEPVQESLRAPVPLLPVSAMPVRYWPDEAQVREALREGQFVAWFVPSFELATGRIEAVELVARWNHPLLGILAPELFLPVVERCNLQEMLWQTLLEQGLALQRQLAAEQRPLRLSLRLQARQLSDRQTCQRIRTLLRRFRCQARHLCLELADHGLHRLTVLEQENLLRLRMLGCDLGLARFGSEQGGSELLCQLPFSRIKLDEQFVKGLPTEPRCQAVVKNGLALAAELHHPLTVPGVDSAEQHLALLALGCESAQGNYLAPPLEREELLRRLRRERCPGASG